MLKYMLDTNMVIYTMKNRPRQVKERFKKHRGRMCISTITLGELIFGAEHSQRIEQNLTDIEGLIARIQVLPLDIGAASHFGQIRAHLYMTGRPIGPYDMLIAGHARAAGLTLVTHKMDEFKRVPGLLVEDWIDGG